jgi:DNA-binding transcriptional regulator YiaG
MPNIATLLKSEIARVARKEIRGEIQQLKQATTQHRAHIAALKRHVLALEKQVKRLSKGAQKTAPPAEPVESARQTRFSAKSLAAQRQRLGLSAHALASLLGVSAQSIYHWEDGKTRPRANQLPAIAALRKLGKKEAVARLEKLAA